MPELSLPAPPADVKQEPTPRPLGTIEIKPEPKDDDASESVPPSFFLCSFGAIHRVFSSVFTYTYSVTNVHVDSLFVTLRTRVHLSIVLTSYRSIVIMYSWICCLFAATPPPTRVPVQPTTSFIKSMSSQCRSVAFCV